MALLNHTNQTANSSASLSAFDKSLALETFKIAFQSLIAILGVFGNFAVCVVVTRNKKTKSSTELLIRNLAVADLGVLMLIFPLAVLKERLPFQWPLGKFVCVYVHPTTETFYGVSVWTIVVISVERYRHLMCPIRKERQRVLKIVKRLIICLWLGNFLIFSVPLFPFMKYEELPGNTICWLRFPTMGILEVYIILLLVIWYCMPVLIIVLTYFAISRKLNQSNVFLRSMNTSESNLSELSTGRPRNRLSLMQQRRLQQNSRVKKILTPVVVAFIVLMLPANAFRTLVLYYPEIVHNKIYPHMVYFLSTCFILNSSINPLIYSFVSPGFRAGLRAILKNKSVRISIIAGSAIRAAGERMTFKMRKRRTYSLNAQENLDAKSVKSDQTPIPYN